MSKSFNTIKKFLKDLKRGKYFDASVNIVHDKIMRGVSRNYFLGDEEASFGADISEEILVWNVHESDSTGTNASCENIVAVAKVCDNDVNNEAIFVSR